MCNCYCTPVPSRRISDLARLELRLAADSAAQVRVSTVFPDGTKKACGEYAIAPNLQLNKVYPDIRGLCGKFQLIVEFLMAEGDVCGRYEQPYEILHTGVPSTGLLDGCWVSIRHWSPTESRYFKDGLENMTDEDWKQHVYSMHEIGVTTVLIQNVFDSEHYVCQHDMTVDTYDGEAFYDSKLYKRRPGMKETDPLEAILTAADACDMAVFPGVGLFAWFDFSPESLEWHKRVATELIEQYGHHKSFYGFYISEEIMGALYYGYPSVPDENYKDIQHFFKEFSAFAHRLAPTKPVALAPNNIDMHLYQEEWKGIMENLDILIPFAFARSENNIPQIAEMCKKWDVHFWVDMEIFRFPFDEGALVPKSFDELMREIHHYDMLEQVYGYQYTGLLNEPGHRNGLGNGDTEELFRAYCAHVQRVRQDCRSEGE